MKAIKLFFIFVVVISEFPSAGYGQDGTVRRLSLDAALKLARERSYRIQISNSQLSRAEGEKLESWSGFLPKFSISENYVRSNDPVTVFSLKLKQGIFSQRDFDLATLNHPGALDNFTTAFQVQQPLFNLDAIYGKSAADLGVKARKFALKRTLQAVAFQVKKAYYGLRLAHENLRAVEEALESARAHRDEAQATFDAGMATEADVLAAEVRVLELQEQRIEAEHQIANASDFLKFLIGLEDEAVIIPTDSLTVPEDTSIAVELKTLARTRSDLQSLHFQTQALRKSLWVTRGGWFPRANAFAAVEWNAAEAFSRDASNWSVGLQLQWKLFDGLGRLGRSRQASARVAEMEARLRQAREKAQMEVRKALRAVQSAEKRLQVARVAVKQAAQSLRIVEERFRQGLEKTSDVLDKETALTHAKMRLLRAKHDYSVALSELQFATGKM